MLVTVSILTMVADRFRDAPCPSTSFRTVVTTLLLCGGSTLSSSHSLTCSKARWSVLIASGISWWPTWSTSSISTSLVVWSAARMSWRKSDLSISLSERFWIVWSEVKAGIIWECGRSCEVDGGNAWSSKRPREFPLVVRCVAVSDVIVPVSPFESEPGRAWPLIASRSAWVSAFLCFSASSTCRSMRIWIDTYKVSWYNTLWKRSEEPTPNSPSASRKELSQVDISSKISSRLKYRFKKGRLVCLIKKLWIVSKDLVIKMWEDTTINVQHNTYSSSFAIGAASSWPKTSPASEISIRMEMRMSAHRSARRKHPRRFIYGVSWDSVLRVLAGILRLTSTSCEASQILSKSCAAGLRPGIGAKSRRSTPIKSASWTTSAVVSKADAMACATLYVNT